MRQRTLVTAFLFVVICGPLFAQDEQQRQRPDSFQQFFILPGIEFSKEQQAKVEEIRKEFAPKLADKVTNVNIGIHHARFGKALKEKMDELGIRCIVNAGGQVLGGGERVSTIDFIKQEFGMTN
jgi:hypothetical protein